MLLTISSIDLHLFSLFQAEDPDAQVNYNGFNTNTTEERQTACLYQQLHSLQSPSTLSNTNNSSEDGHGDFITNLKPDLKPRSTPLEDASVFGSAEKKRTPSTQIPTFSEQSFWSLENLPDILYVLRPGTDHAKSRARIRQIDISSDKTINHFPVLPFHIFPQVQGWLIETWMRLDRRITPEDIIDRMNPQAGITSDDIEMRRQKFRESFNIACWGSQKSTYDITRKLKEAGIDPALNTTRGLTPGLIDPSKGEAGGRIPLPADAYDGPVSSEFKTPTKKKPSLGTSSHFNQNPTPSSTGKRKTETTNPPANASPRKRSRSTRYTAIPKPEPYGNTEEYELAYHGGPSAFKVENEEPGGSTMTLEEYLQMSGMSYEDWLLRDKEGQMTKQPGLQVPETWTLTPSKGDVIDPWAILWSQR
ncbi:hypothetical protein MW887_007083 [Aspergillus wentii]|nr:hypothetical protein MW887_007083 [Aspergillus wentii]